MAPAARVRYVLDTNILVHYLRANALGGWVEATYGLLTASMAPLISVVTEGELLALALKSGWGDARKRRMRELLRSLASTPLETSGVIEAYAAIEHYSRTVPRTMDQNDI